MLRPVWGTIAVCAPVLAREFLTRDAGMFPEKDGDAVGVMLWCAGERQRVPRRGNRASPVELEYYIGALDHPPGSCVESLQEPFPRLLSSCGF